MANMNTGQQQTPADFARYLKGADFPADKEALKECARDNGADDSVLQSIDAMQEDEFQTMADVMKGFGDTSGQSTQQRQQ